jgi:hypothetical protein
VRTYANEEHEGVAPPEPETTHNGGEEGKGTDAHVEHGGYSWVTGSVGILLDECIDADVGQARPLLARRRR